MTRRLCIGGVCLGAALVMTLAPSPSWAGEVGEGDEDRVLTARDLKPLQWRSIGPANMGGRVAAIAMVPDEPKRFFIGYATGGLWTTANNGTTYTPLFDDINDTSSIGAVAVARPGGWTDADAEEREDLVIWVGTGEGNNRNSSSWGHGVYRSVDGGKTFEHVGLADSHNIPAMALDPRDPDVCYVAALGHLWGWNETRGVYKTTDGGKTWKPVLHFDDRTGACEVIIDPSNPDRIYAAMYARKRTGWSYEIGSEASGIYRSDNGGDRWAKLTEGLPAVTGRIGLDIFQGDTSVVFASVQSSGGGRVVDEWQDRSRSGGVFKSTDHGDTWERLTDFAPRSFYFSRIRVDPKDQNRIYLLGWEVYVSDDGGRTFVAGKTNVTHVDFHAMVIDSNDADHLLVGNDGGLYISHDRAETWDFQNHMAVGQFYNVSVDDSAWYGHPYRPYRVGGGLQDNGSWIGVSETIRVNDGEFMGRAGGISNNEWKAIWGGDGFHVEFDREDPNVMYVEWQGGNLARLNMDTGVSRELKPAASEGEPRYRFNWNAPFLISAHDPSVLYHGGNHVFKMNDRGDRWEQISTDLTRNDEATNRAAGSEAESYNTLVSLAESPLEAGVLWAGADDGLIHVTTDDGVSWKDITPEAGKGGYVSKIEPSAHDAATAYVAIDGHRSDFHEPIVLMTTNHGAQWTSISGDLPDDQPVKVIREDPNNPNVLYAGTERASYVTIDRGGHWIRLNGDKLPTVAVDDLKIQSSQMDLVAGTHGRSIWILDDVSPLSQLTNDVVQSEFHVFKPVAAQPRHMLVYDGMWSDAMFVAANPAMGAYLHYWIRDYQDEDVKIVIEDAAGNTIRKLEGTNRPGLNRVVWDLQRTPRELLGNPDNLKEFVPAGEYTVKITHGEDCEGEMTVTVLAEPGAAK